MFCCVKSKFLKKTLKPFILILVLILILSVFLDQKNTAVALLYGYSLKEVPIYRVERDDKKIAISFDCAWGNEYTDELLKHMNFYNVKCTFFTVSFWAERYPEEIKKIVDAGHEIGTHSKTHSYMSKQNSEEINAELEYSTQIIEKLTNKKVELFRAPYGDYDDLLLQCAKSRGLYTIQWDVDSLDWKDLSAKEISMRVVSKVKSGSIILCHNNGLHTAESLPLIFSTLQAQGYEFVKISELIYRDNYKMGVDGSQIKVQ